MIRRGLWVRPLLIALLPCANIAMAQGLTLQLPVDCTLGDTCYIQQYMDRDPEKGFSDYQCSSLSYDGHKGTDFAVRTIADMEAGVNVVAAADGRVRGFREGMPDTGFNDETAAAIDGKECGNGVVLVHPGGWETQYCHLKLGSIAIRNDQTVKAGDILGQIGQSGRAEFPHLHMSVRQGGKPVDPFDPDGTVTCASPGDSTLWADTPAYQPGGIVDMGMSDSVPDYDAVKTKTVLSEVILPKAPAMVIYGLTFGTKKDDVMRLEIIGPDGEVLSKDSTLERNHARAYRAVGKRRKRSATWPIGTYTGTASLLRDGKVISMRQAKLRVE